MLPGTLSTTRTTLADLVGFSNQLRPTATALLPTARTLPSTLRRSRTLILATSLLPLNRIRAFEAAVAPLARELPRVEAGLSTVVPELSNAFRVLHYVTNELAYGNRANPGFLYWLAWFAHNADSFLSTSDANGSAWRTLSITSCAGLKSFSFGPLIEALLGTNFGCS
jgi:phospholipid/cholesterol/gamma-HCH transport system substrate-binding protein